MSSDHIRWGIYMFGDAPSPLADALNSGGAMVEPVARSAWGWRCGGCGGVLEKTGDVLSPAIPGVPSTFERWADKHVAHASWVNHPDYCQVRVNGKCSCGRETT